MTAPTSPSTKQFGQRCREEMVRLGIDRAAIASATGYTTASVGGILNGTPRMTAAFLAGVEPLGFDLLYIITGKRGANQ